MAMGQVLAFDSPARRIDADDILDDTGRVIGYRVPEELRPMRAGDDDPTIGAGGVEALWIPNPWRGARVLMLGCGAKPMIGAVNHDLHKHSPWVDVAWNLDEMPWADKALAFVRGRDGLSAVEGGEFDVVYAYDLVEHLKDAYGFVNECHAAIRPGGILIFRMASWDNPVSYRDLTHRHYAHEESFDFFDRDTCIGQGYSSFHPMDSLGRLPTHWRIDGVDRTNPDPRYRIGDLQWTMVRL